MHDPKTWKIRSILNLYGFSDDTVNDEPSMTDPSQDESIEDLVARMMRGEQVGTANPVYDYPNGVKPEDAILPVVEQSGFDLADAPAIISAAEAAGASLATPATPVVATPTPEPAKEPN